MRRGEKETRPVLIIYHESWRKATEKARIGKTGREKRKNKKTTGRKRYRFLPVVYAGS
jgi:hypothetical protein